MTTATGVREPEVQKLVVAKRQSTVPPPFRRLPARPLFSECLVESGGVSHGRRAVSTVISFIFQCLLLGVAILLPLMYTDVLPKQQMLTFLVAPPPPPPPAAAATPTKVVQRVSEINDGHLRTPGRIPAKVQMIREEEPPPAIANAGVAGGVPGGIPGGQLGGVIGGIISATSNFAAVPKLALPTLPKRMRMSQGVTEGRLIEKIEPEYPPLAKAGRIQGAVVLSAIISKTEEIQNLTLVSGHPMLVPAAIKAVQKFRYRPFLLNGEPVEVETTVTVNFRFSS